MIAVAADWGALAAGLGFGLLSGALFFGGLRLGLTFALASARPAAWLLLSALFRFTLLLGALWLAATEGGWTLAGFVLGLLAARTGALFWARVDGRAG